MKYWGTARNAVNWWLRSPNLNNSGNAWNVNSNGNANNNNCSYTGYYLRPALMDTPDQVGISRTPRPHLQRGLYPVQLLRVEDG